MKASRRETLCFSLFLLLLAAVAREVIGQLVALSWIDGLASHILLVPFVSLALIVRKRDGIFASVRREVGGGVALIVAGASILLAGRYLFENVAAPTLLSVKVFGLVVAILGGFFLFYGGEAFRAARFPLLFLAFMVPIPPPVVDAATAALKAGSVEAVDTLFSLTGTPYHREGFVFLLPNVAIEIADECSGIRSSLGLLLTMLLGAHAFLRRGWTKGVLLLAIVPVAVLKNGIRIVTLTLLAVHVDPSFLTGQLHHEGGIVFFLLALAMLMPVLFWLRRAETRSEPLRAAVLVPTGSRR